MGYPILGIRSLLIALGVVGAALPTAAADRVQTLLQTLADAPGPSGFEEAVRAVMAARSGEWLRRRLG